jgi:hypothetical protein
MISGNNFQFGRKRTAYSYYFSRYPHIWGWASWRRAWDNYDVDMKMWPEIRDGGGLPESVVNGETGFTCPQGDLECFVSQIIKLLDDDKLREKMGQSGKLRAETLFSEEVQEEKNIRLYTSLYTKRIQHV